MSERIYRAVTEDFIRRMRNWAKVGAGAMADGVRISSIYSIGVRVDRYVSTVPPLLTGEADDTALALLSVPIRYRQAVERFWQYEGQSLRSQARLVRIDLNHHTFEAWVMKGHELLIEELAMRAAAFHERCAANARSAISA